MVRGASVGASASASDTTASSRLSYDLVYLDDNNRESDVSEDEIRLVRDTSAFGSILPDEEPGGSGSEGTDGGQAGGIRTRQIDKGIVGKILEAKADSMAEKREKVCLVAKLASCAITSPPSPGGWNSCMWWRDNPHLRDIIVAHVPHVRDTFA